MSAIYSALAGMANANQRLQTAARQIAKWAFSQQPDTVDLSAQAVELIQARNENAANVKVAQTAEQMDRTTLDLIG